MMGFATERTGAATQLGPDIEIGSFRSETA